jgi:hypothetical protein
LLPQAFPSLSFQRRKRPPRSNKNWHENGTPSKPHLDHFQFKSDPQMGSNLQQKPNITRSKFWVHFKMILYRFLAPCKIQFGLRKRKKRATRLSFFRFMLGRSLFKHLGLHFGALGLHFGAPPGLLASILELLASFLELP